MESCEEVVVVIISILRMMNFCVMCILNLATSTDWETPEFYIDMKSAKLFS